MASTRNRHLQRKTTYLRCTHAEAPRYKYVPYKEPNPEKAKPIGQLQTIILDVSGTHQRCNHLRRYLHGLHETLQILKARQRQLCGEGRGMCSLDILPAKTHHVESTKKGKPPDTENQ